MKEYITQEQAEKLAHRRATKYAHRTAPLYCSYAFVPHTLMDFVRDIEAAAIQHYRDSLVAGVVLPEPVANAVHKGELVYTADQLRQAIAAAIQHYRDSLVAGVVLPEPVAFRYKDDSTFDGNKWCDKYGITDSEQLAKFKHVGEKPIDPLHTADQLRQAIADALAKQDVRAPMFKFRECEDSQAAAPDPKTNNLAATVFVYRNRVTSEINCVYVEGAKDLESSPVWEHLATLEPRLWIQAHYEKVMTLDPKEAV